MSIGKVIRPVRVTSEMAKHGFKNLSSASNILQHLKIQWARPSLNEKDLEILSRKELRKGQGAFCSAHCSHRLSCSSPSVKAPKDACRKRTPATRFPPDLEYQKRTTGDSGAPTTFLHLQLLKARMKENMLLKVVSCCAFKQNYNSKQKRRRT